MFRKTNVAGLVKDEKGVIHSSSEEYDKYKANRKDHQRQRAIDDQIQGLKNEMTEIKNLILQAMKQNG